MLADLCRTAQRRFWLLVGAWIAWICAFVGWALSEVIIRGHSFSLPIAVVLVAIAVWPGVRYFRIRPAAQRWYHALADDEVGRLRATVDEVAEDMDLPAPHRLGLMADPGFAVDLDVDGAVTLVIGGPTIWTLDATELRREVRAPLLVAAAHRSRDIQRLDRRRTRLAGIATGLFAPAFTGLFLKFFHACASTRAALWRWAEESVTSGEPSAPESPAQKVAEAWECFSATILAAAHRQSVRPNALFEGFADYVSWLAAQGVLSDPGRSTSGQPAADLLADRRATDSVLTEDAYRPVLSTWGTFDWHEYAEVVVVPLWREDAAALLHAVSVTAGRVVPATVSSVWPVIVGDLDTVAAVLGASPESTRAVTAHHLGALASVALLDAGRATVRLDWLEGGLLISLDGHGFPCRQAVEVVVEQGRLDPLASLLEDAGLTIDDRVLVAGQDPGKAPPFPRPLFPVERRGRSYSLALHGTDLVVLSAALQDWLPRRLRFLRPWLAGQRHDLHEEMTMAELAEADAVHRRFPVADIVAVRLRAKRSGPAAWGCEISTGSDSWTCRGDVPVEAVARIMESLVGDRLTTRGLTRSPDGWSPVLRFSHGRRILRRTAWVLVAVTVSLASAPFLTLTMGFSHTGRVVDCGFVDERAGCRVLDADSDRVELVMMPEETVGGTVDYLEAPSWVTEELRAKHVVRREAWIGAVVLAALVVAAFGLRDPATSQTGRRGHGTPTSDHSPLVLE